MSLRSEKLSEQFTSKQWLWITDSNQGSYNGQINIESSSLSNSGRWLSFSEAVLTIPIVLAFKGSVDLTADINPFCAQLKNGYHHLIDSCEIQFGNVSVSQTVPFSNILTSFKLMTTMSVDGLYKYGPLLNFWPDTSASYFYSQAVNANGQGVCNNRLVTLAAFGKLTLNLSFQRNEGRLKRLYTTNYVPTQATTLTEFTSVAAAKTLGRGFFGNDGGAAAARIYYVQMLGVVRLADISDFCKQLPLTKGAFLKLTLNTNTSINIITNVAAGPTMGIAAAADVIIRGRTNPVNVSSAATDEPNADSVGAGDGTFLVEVAIQKTTAYATVITNDMQSGVRLYVPAYQMTPEYEEQYISMKPVQEVVYQDAYQYTVRVAAGQSNTTLLTNGIIDPQYIVVAPMLNGEANNNMTVAVSAIQSPFSSEPATTSPIGLSQFNVQLSGKNIFQQDVNYDWQTFLGELSAINCLNGGQSTELTSGLIDYEMWSSIYRYYVADLSRGDESSKYIPKSVQLQCTNSSTKIADLYCFIVYNRKIAFRTVDSQIVQL